MAGGPDKKLMREFIMHRLFGPIHTRDGPEKSRGIRLAPAIGSIIAALAHIQRKPSVNNEVDVRLIAFYLPQFHRTKENDEWWGEGFTEWTNVRRARAAFPGHLQPRVPAQELGYYDLTDPRIPQLQAELARKSGISAFCYYYYWFGQGKRMLERPVDALLKPGSPDFPFCMCWANENWTRTWDGQDSTILMQQTYSAEEDAAFIRSLLPFFKDRRHVRVNGKPLLLVYRVENLPDARATTTRWRDICRAELGVEPYLVNVLSTRFDGAPQATGGFDAAVEFPPHGTMMSEVPLEQRRPGFRGAAIDYISTARELLSRAPYPFKFFRGVMPQWDNTPRRPDDGICYVNTHPQNYLRWLQMAVRQTRKMHAGDERLVFINAWNEWGEGAYLEPDSEYGNAWLEATAAALK